jgi:hypothetical protein
MSNYIPVKIDFQDLGFTSGYSDHPFHKGLTGLRNEGMELITCRDTAVLRSSVNDKDVLSGLGHYTREGIIYFPRGNPIVVKKSPILLDPEVATKAHEKGREFYPTDAQIQDAKASGFYELRTNESFRIPTSNLGSDAFGRFIFGNAARIYGNHIRQMGIKELPVIQLDETHDCSYVDSQPKPFARQAWMRNLVQYSALTFNTGIGFDSRVRGLRI